VTDLNLQSFNLVTQADSTIMKAESGSMKIIAAMTLVFLPCTAVAVSDAFLSKQFFLEQPVLIPFQTIFSTPFFYLHDNDKKSLGMSPYFWLIWVISIPLTLLVLYAWHRYQKLLAKHLFEDTQPTSAHESARGIRTGGFDSSVSSGPMSV
jgi:hypothetical protein